MTDTIQQPWIRSYALRPRLLSDGGWVWLRGYEWRWARPAQAGPMALSPPRVQSRGLSKAPASPA